jgi:hypothetical protein
MNSSHQLTVSLSCSLPLTHLKTVITSLSALSSHMSKVINSLSSTSRCTSACRHATTRLVEWGAAASSAKSRRGEENCDGPPPPPPPPPHPKLSKCACGQPAPGGVSEPIPTSNQTGAARSTVPCAERTARTRRERAALAWRRPPESTILIKGTSHAKRRTSRVT